jgi:hypothetical protein
VDTGYLARFLDRAGDERRVATGRPGG